MVTVELCDLTCTLSPGGDSSREDQEAAVRAIQGTKHGGGKLFSEYAPLQITSSDLCEWTRRYTQQSVVRVKLYDLTCNLSPDGDSSREDQEAAVRAIQCIEHGGRGLVLGLSIN